MQLQTNFSSVYLLRLFIAFYVHETSLLPLNVENLNENSETNGNSVYEFTLYPVNTNLKLR